VVETGGLENRCAGNRTGGSNPSPSASNFLLLQLFGGSPDISEAFRLKPAAHNRCTLRLVIRSSMSRFTQIGPTAEARWHPAFLGASITLHLTTR
jgi:hypothetical protein